VLLAIDVGNTDTKLGFYARSPEGLRLEKNWRITTAGRRTADEFGIALAALFRRADIPTARVEQIAISSVVPQNDRALAEACLLYFEHEPVFFTAASQVAIEVATERPREVGSDLICAAVAAREKYGAPVIVVGFGTATTFSAVGADGRFLGAAIAPGIQVSIDALVARTAKLPQVALEAPPGPIGRDTVHALQAGIVFGFVGQTEGLVGRIKREIGQEARVIATGGLADVVARHTKAIDAVEPHLVLEGLRLVSERGRVV
jgi:type III pantothenate kinase